MNIQVRKKRLLIEQVINLISNSQKLLNGVFKSPFLYYLNVSCDIKK